MTTPDDPSVDAPSADDAGNAEDEVTRLQRDLDVANDCAPADEDRPPGDPAG